jgi:hypothetical protein
MGYLLCQVLHVKTSFTRRLKRCTVFCTRFTDNFLFTTWKYRYTIQRALWLKARKPAFRSPSQVHLISATINIQALMESDCMIFQEATRRIHPNSAISTHMVWRLIRAQAAWHRSAISRLHPHNEIVNRRNVMKANSTQHTVENLPDGKRSMLPAF